MPPFRATDRAASFAGGVAIFAAAAAFHLAGAGGPAVAPESELIQSVEQFVTSGHRDVDGRRVPLMVHVSDELWLPPVPVYAGALAAAVSDAANRPRLAASVVGALNVVLLFVLVRYVFDSVLLGSAAALMLLLTPGHLTFARTFTADGVWHVPFVCGWLIAIAVYQRAPGSPRALSAGLMLAAASIYSQPSAALMVPILVFLTWYGLSSSAARPADRRPTARLVWQLTAVLAVVLVPLLLWFAIYPSSYADTFGRWLLHPANIRSPIDGAKATLNWVMLTNLTSTYWEFMSPVHLMVSQTAPAYTGVFLLAVGCLFVVGALAAVLATPREADGLARSVSVVALLGCVTLPLAAAAFHENRSVGRALAMVPMGIVVSVYGAQSLWRTALGRVAVLVLAIAALLQFWYWRVS